MNLEIGCSKTASPMTPSPSRREEGWLLIEAMISLTILTVGVLAFIFSFQANFRATRELGSRDQAQVALDAVVETLHSSNFKSLYATYQNQTFTAAGLVDPAGNPAVIRVQFDVNEMTLPLEYGPVADIDGDGVKNKNTTDASTTYVILPTRLTLTYQMSYGPETKTVFILLGE